MLFFQYMRDFFMFVTAVCVLFLLKLKWLKNIEECFSYFSNVIQETIIT